MPSTVHRRPSKNAPRAWSGESRRPKPSVWRRFFGPKRHYHFGLPVVVYLFITLLLAVGAFNSQNNLLFGALGFAFAALIVSGVMSGRMLMGMGAHRRPFPSAHVGDVVSLAYRVKNIHRHGAAYALTVEEFGIAKSTRAEAAKTPKAGAAPATSRARVRMEEAGFVEFVAPLQHAPAAVKLQCLARGPVELNTIRISTVFPFGLIRKSVDFDEPETLLIRPKLLALPAGLVRQVLQTGSGMVASSRRMGQGEEFFALREYTEGDSPRSIAWRASAQRMALGSPNGIELLVRQNAMPGPIRMWIVLRFAGAETRIEQEHAISVVASLAREAVNRGISVGLSVPECDVLLKHGGGQAQLNRLYDELALLSPPPPLVSSVATASSPPRAVGFPRSIQAKSAMCAVVHAGPVDRGFAPPGAAGISHVAAAQAMADDTPPTTTTLSAAEAKGAIA